MPIIHIVEMGLAEIERAMHPTGRRSNELPLSDIAERALLKDALVVFADPSPGLFLDGPLQVSHDSFRQPIFMVMITRRPCCIRDKFNDCA